jgi:hypothetical protein
MLQVSRPVDIRRWHELSASILGLGAIGRLIALQLASLNVRRLQLIDSRVVTQLRQRLDGFDHEDVGRRRADAVAQSCHQINPNLEVYARRDRRSLPSEVVDVIVVSPGGTQQMPALQRLVGDQTIVVVMDVLSGGVRCEFNRGTRAVHKLLRHKGASARSAVSLPAAHAIAGLAVLELNRMLTANLSKSRIELKLHDAGFSVIPAQ